MSQHTTSTDLSAHSAPNGVITPDLGFSFLPAAQSRGIVFAGIRGIRNDRLCRDPHQPTQSRTVRSDVEMF